MACAPGAHVVPLRSQWGDLICVNVKRYGRVRAIERLLCDINCMQACGVKQMRDKIAAYVDVEEQSLDEMTSAVTSPA